MTNGSHELSEFTWELFERRVVRQDLLPAIMDELGGPEVCYALIVPPDPKLFDAGVIADRLQDARIDELYRGAIPSTQEFDWWRAAMRAEAEHGGGPCFQSVSLWRVERPTGQYLLCAAIHEDQGTITECLGPFASRAEAEQALLARGELGS
jgi:hypothetical protein